MHWIERGPEPSTLRTVRRRYTGGWVRFYRHHLGAAPSDSRWREFRLTIREIFHGLCAYCEGRCRGEVEHFRPKSLFPELVYRWSNWLLACHDCNHAKLQKWPRGGYVDPCARPWPGLAETYFKFELGTGEILPREDLPPESRHKAQRTICDLGLNDLQHLEDRLEWLMIVDAMILDHWGEVDSEGRKHVQGLSSRTSQYSSLVRAWLCEQGIDTH
jgi:uncharacterized protein (TIGR02646 family)